MALGQRQLVVGHAVLEQAVELVPDELENLARTTRRRARVHGEGAALEVRRPVGVHGVHQAALFADLLEEPARHPTAEDLVQGREGEAVIVAPREGPHPHDHIGLLGRPGAHDLPAGRRRSTVVRRRSRAGNRRHAALEARRYLVVVQVAGGRQHQIRGPVVGEEVPGDGVAAEGRDRLCGREHLAPGRMLWEQGFGEQVVDELRGLVLVHQDLLEDHLALGLELVGAERRRTDDVAQDVEAEVEVVVEQARVEGRVLLGGEGVHLAAHRLHRLRDLPSRALLSALEQQVLEEVRHTPELETFVAGSDVDPEAERYRAHIRHPLGDETDAVGQRGSLDGVGVCDHSVTYRRPGPPRRPLRRGPPRSPPPRPPPRPPPPCGDSAGPRSPNFSLASPSKVSSKDAYSRVAPPSPDGASAPPDVSVLRAPTGAGSRAWPPPLPPSSPRGDSETLPCGSMSSTRTVSSSPRLSTSSTRSTRLPRPSLEM